MLRGLSRLATSQAIFAHAGKRSGRAMMSGGTSAEKVQGPVEASIVAKIAAALEPVELKVINESYMHNVPKDSESHFKIVVVSDAFDGMRPIQRHRAVNSLLQKEFDAGLHALSIVAKTPAQWGASNKIDASPNCLGGGSK